MARTGAPFDRAEFFGTRHKRDDEDQLQIALVEHIGWRHVPGLVWYMIPNHGVRSATAAGKAKKMGLRKGASDLGFILPPNGQSAFLELKFGKNTASGDQEKFGVDVTAAGGLFAVAWDIDTALRILEAWGAIKPESL